MKETGLNRIIVTAAWVISLIMLCLIVENEIFSEDIQTAKADSYYGALGYPLPITCYTISTGKVEFYSDNDLENVTQYIDGNNTRCEIVSVVNLNGENYAMILRSGETNALIPLREFTDSSEWDYDNAYERTITYRRCDLSQKLGTIFPEDEIIVISEYGDAVQIIYPTTKGYEMGWVKGSKLSQNRSTITDKSNDEHAFIAVLSGEVTFTDFDTKTEADVYTLPYINGKYIGCPEKHAMIDLDNDGTQELLIEYDTSGDTAILRIQNGRYIAYYIPYRARIEIKKDGTMSWSNSAEESGVHRVNFRSSGIYYINTIVCNTATNVFEIENKPVSKIECEYALGKYHEKENVLWKPL